MHPLFTKPLRMTHDVIGAGIEVHKIRGRDCLNRSTSDAFEAVLPGANIERANKVDRDN